ncbi:DUF6134 family protein [Variovorax sp. LT2P21]|uniref:DUF6134 family protein n=1 Tax=Variovorax sp. LT2P21 TaxID=3443731 RepID=UPI003F454B58
MSARWRLGIAAWLSAVPLVAGAADTTYDFQVLLDDKPIGEHRFTVGGPPEARTVLSDARFAVKLMGLTVYRYTHRAAEQWRGNCLRSLVASTDDDGTPSRVTAEAAGDVLKVVTGEDTQPIEGCAMSFAYWNPAIRQQSRLLNAQTGRHEAVQVSRVASGTVEARGQTVPAVRWRIDGPAQPVDVWYTAQGEWVGLDSTVGGGRKLSYRLR